MKTTLSKSESIEKINSFFQKKNFAPKDLRKIKRLAMKHHISLKNYKKSFCKKCLNPLKGKIRITKTHKTIECSNCNFKNKFRINKD